MTDTFVAQSTPIGVSAIALIRINGSACHQFAQALLPKNSTSIKPRHAYHSAVHDIGGELIDEVVWIFYPAETSYTGDPLLEIMPHGNPILCKKLMDHFCALGCRLAEPGEFTKRAYLNGRLKFSQVEGVLEVIHAQSERALFYARKQLTGESGKQIKGIVQELTSLRAEIEAYIDFPDEALPPEDVAGPLHHLQRLIERFDSFETNAKNREIIQGGLNTLIVGPPNAGKSSLLNGLVGHNRALVSAISGTTRDYILERITVGDFLVNLFDTAGLHSSPNSELEHEGIHRTLELIEQADFFLLVVDSNLPVPVLPDALIQKLNSQNSIVILNKIDLGKSVDFSNFLSDLLQFPMCTFNPACMKRFLECWQDRIESRILEKGTESMMFNARQSQFIRQAREELIEAVLCLKTNSATELAAFHLIEASNALVQINERIDNEDVLDDLFHRFCIGK
jgi:tRNA modification GTPase